MSKITYMVGDAQFSFDTNLQYVSENQLFQLEEKLLMEIKEHKHFLAKQLSNGIIHDVYFEDDKGIIGTVKDFKEFGNLIIKKNKP